MGLDKHIESSLSMDVHFPALLSKLPNDHDAVLALWVRRFTIFFPDVAKNAIHLELDDKVVDKNHPCNRLIITCKDHKRYFMTMDNSGQYALLTPIA